MSITLDLKYIEKFIPQEEFSYLAPRVLAAQKALNLGTGAGSDKLNWKEPYNLISDDDFKRLISCSQKIKDNSDVVIVVGSGFSYIGAKAAIDWLSCSSQADSQSGSPKLLFLGQDMCTFRYDEVFSQCEGKRVSLIVISSPNDSPEALVAMRLSLSYMQKRYGSTKENRVVVVESLSNSENDYYLDKGYESFYVPFDINGGYLLFCAAGLLPMACAGIDITELFEGFKAACEEYKKEDIEKNPALVYSLVRYALYQQGFSAEMLCSWNGFMDSTLNWARGLFSSSCGKDSKGLLCTNISCTSDIYSMGQFIEKGSKIVFETMFSIYNWGKDKVIEALSDDPDEEDFLNGKSLSLMAKEMEKGVASAHHFAGIPVAKIVIGRKTAHDYGKFIYFMQYTAAVSAYLLGVNPFELETAEKYKKNMFGLLGKPGYDKPRLL